MSGYGFETLNATISRLSFLNAFPNAFAALLIQLKVKLSLQQRLRQT